MAPVQATWLSRNGSGELVLMIWVQPGAKNTEIVGTHADRLKIKVAAPPVEGAANKALVKFIASKLNLKKQYVRISAGTTSRKKSVLISHTNDEVWARLSEWAEPSKK